MCVYEIDRTQNHSRLFVTSLLTIEPRNGTFALAFFGDPPKSQGDSKSKTPYQPTAYFVSRGEDELNNRESQPQLILGSSHQSSGGGFFYLWPRRSVSVSYDADSSPKTAEIELVLNGLFRSEIRILPINNKCGG